MKTWLIILLAPLSLLAVPNDPDNLVFTPSTNSVELNWEDMSNNETGFKIYRNGILIQQVEAGVTHCHDSTLQPNTTYFYTVASTDDIAINDADFIYKDGEDMSIEQVDSLNIGIYNPTLIDTFNDTHTFYDNSNTHTTVTYKIDKKDGGFDVAYEIYAKKDTKLPILKIPNIKFANTDNLHILNPYFQHYMQERNLTVELNYSDRVKGKHNSYSVANMVRTINNGTKIYENHQPYGSQFVYSPVIVAHDNNFAAGSALHINYEDDLKVYMYITKNDNNNTDYVYDLSENTINRGETKSFKLSMRFSDAAMWKYTLHPYKTFFNDLLAGKKRLPRVKNLNPIQILEMGGYEHPDYSAGDRHWSTAVTYGTDEVKLKNYFKEKGKELRDNGFKRMAIWNFTGLYGNRDDGEDTSAGALMYQLPFQFVAQKGPILPSYMQADVNALKVLDIHSDDNPLKGIATGYDWGISGNIPVDENDVTLKTDVWKPHDLVPFDYNNASHRAYANYTLNVVKNLEGLFIPSFIRLDALERMEAKGRVKWLEQMQTTLPHITFATESSIDYMHGRTADILRPNSVFRWMKDDTHHFYNNEQDLSQPNILANYLNPGAESYVLVAPEGRKGQNANHIQYIKKLVDLGYTPLIEHWEILDIN